ncbi:MAG: hypothetical protein QOK17_2935 [Sphingomonadales bacterium]|jgi:hypothetical protein|nr:hypothetical protein [Sphingomonadales bacterium]
MTARLKRAALAAVGGAALVWLATPAQSQQPGPRGGGIPTETQERLAAGMQDQSFDWNWIGLFGLFGLAGLHHKPDYAHSF